MQTANFKLKKKGLKILQFAVCTLQFAVLLSVSSADQVIMKDGTVYKGKILIDTDKAILIGNPPLRSEFSLLKSEDIAKIIYEEYHPNPPAERKRGLVFETRLDGQVASSSLLPLSPSPGIYAGGGFRVHPAFEIDGGGEWNPALSASNGFSVSDSTGTNGNTRQYQDFFMYTGMVNGRIYPFYEKKWKTEPYLLAGYSWSNLIPKASGDNLTGSGWQLGFSLAFFDLSQLISSWKLDSPTNRPGSTPSTSWDIKGASSLRSMSIYLPSERGFPTGSNSAWTRIRGYSSDIEDTIR